MSRAGALRLVVAAGLTGFLLWKSDPASVAAAARGADWRPIAVAVILVLIDRALMAYRWVALLCIVEPAARPSLGAIMRIFFVSTFVGTFLPASVGSDAVRAYSVMRLNVGGGDAVASVLMDRVLGVASILIMALVGLTLASDLVDNWTILTALIVSAAACFIALALVFSRRAAAIAARATRVLPANVRQPVERGVGSLLDSIGRYAAYHRELAQVLLASLAVQTLRIAQAYYLGRGLGIAAPASAYLAFIPLILLIMLLPVTINGIGTSQAAFVWFFARAGVPSASAFALSILFVALGIVGNLPGGLLYAAGRSSSPSAGSALRSG